MGLIREFSKDSLLKGITAIEQTVKEPLAKEATAVKARKEAGNFGAMGLGMRAPDPRTFAEKRTESVQEQLSGKRNGYVPASGLLHMGGPGR